MRALALTGHVIIVSIVSIGSTLVSAVEAAPSTEEHRYLALECAKKLERKLRHSPRRETDPRVRWLHGKLEALDKADTAFVRLSWVPTRVEMLNGEFFQLAMPVWGVKKQNSELGVELWVSDPYVYPDSKLSPTQAQSLLGLECHVLTLLQSEAREAPDNAWVRYRTLQERANVHISGHPCR